MGEVVEHKHVVVRAKLSQFFSKDQGDDAKAWCASLVKKMGMNLLMGPFAVYVDRPGLRGWTIACIIETSHIVIHVWDECTPVLAQFDVYTCGSLDLMQVLEHLEPFGHIESEYLLLDREHALTHIDSGKIKGAVDA